MIQGYKRPPPTEAETKAAIERAAQNYAAFIALTGAPLHRYSQPGRSR
jgi:hypothetical protein